MQAAEGRDVLTEMLDAGPEYLYAHTYTGKEDDPAYEN
jgi:hypothetical protein